jgi:hypothetical protein
MDKRARLGIALGAACLLAGVVLALLVDSRLDRQLGGRVAMLALALVCAAIVGGRRRRGIRAIGWTGVVLWGGFAPLTLTASVASPEAKFAMAVHDDAKAAATQKAQSAITIDDIKAAAAARGGAVGVRTDTGVSGADAYPLVLRPDPARNRPRICLTIEHGTEARIRRC